MTVSLPAAFRRARRAASLETLPDFESLSALLATATLVAIVAMASLSGDDLAASSADASIAPPFASTETVASAYAGVPFYHRSDVHLARPDATDLTLKRLGWDGDSLYFPIDGGARVVRWSGSFGLMVDFLHNKAIARLGKGSHGRKISDPVIEDVETAGTLKGQSAPSPLRLTELFDRLEFTHGHNTLMLTGLARLPPVVPAMRPYVGAGFGAAVPHVEVWFAGSENEKRTNEYQVAGPAFQLLAGLELRVGRGSYYLEYKFIWASIEAALTGSRSKSLKDLQSPWLPRWLVEPFAGLMEVPGDMWRQFSRWLRGEGPLFGTLSTRLISHEPVIGAGYVWPGIAPAKQ